MTLFDFTKAKRILGETGNTNDNKIQRYGDMADNYIYSFLINVEPVIPLPNPPSILVTIATELCVSLFYKFESGDLETAKQSEETFAQYFESSYRRPHFFSTS